MQKITRSQHFTLLFFFFLALALRVFRISQDSLWDDEGTSFILASVSLDELFYAIRNYYFSPPLWPLLCRVFTFFAPTSPWIVRLPSLFAGLAVFFPLYAWTRDQGHRKAGCFAFGLLALSPIGIFYAQEGRNYLLMSTLYFSALFATWRYIESKKRVYLAMVVVATAANLLLHDIGGALWLGLNFYFLVTLVMQNRQKELVLWKHWFMAQFILLLAALAYLPIFLHHLRMVQPVNPYQFFWEKNFWFHGTLTSLRNLVPGDFSPISRMPIPHLSTGGWTASGMTLGLLILANPWKLRRTLLPLFAATLAPLLAIAILSDVITPAYWIGRTEVLVLPVFCLLLGNLLAEVKTRALAGGIFVIFLFCGAASLWDFHTSSTSIHKKWDAITAASLFSEGKPDLIIVEKETRASVSAHLMPLTQNTKVTPFPYPTAFQAKNWPSRVLQIQKSQTVEAQDLASALQTIHHDILGMPVHTLAIVYASQNVRGENFRGAHVNDLLRILQHSGCTYQKRPELFPMDYHQGGRHVVVHMKCEPPQ